MRDEVAATAESGRASKFGMVAKEGEEEEKGSDDEEATEVVVVVVEVDAASVLCPNRVPTSSANQDPADKNITSPVSRGPSMSLSMSLTS